jgi:hypothetical protein
MGREAGVLRYETTWLNKENVKRRPEVKAEVLGADDAAVGVDLKRISVVELASRWGVADAQPADGDRKFEEIVVA